MWPSPGPRLRWADGVPCPLYLSFTPPACFLPVLFIHLFILFFLSLSVCLFLSYPLLTWSSRIFSGLSVPSLSGCLVYPTGSKEMGGK